MTDFSTHLVRMLAHYQALHRTPGWKEYVEARVYDMAQRNPELYSELAARFHRTVAQRQPARRR